MRKGQSRGARGRSFEGSQVDLGLEGFGGQHYRSGKWSHLCDSGDIESFYVAKGAFVRGQIEDVHCTQAVPSCKCQTEELGALPCSKH